MMPPVPGDAPTWFTPYLYTPSEGAGYTKLVTPFGNIDVTGALRDEFLNVVIAVVVVAFSVGAWRACVRKRSSTSRPSSKATKELGKGAGKASSALEENIQTKGANSYYYAHQRRTANTGAENSLKKTKVSTYGWTDEKKTVSIYLTDDVVTDMNDDQLKLNWSETSLSMDLLVSSGSKLAKSLVIPTLYSVITNVTWKKKKSQLVITLHKKEPTPWKSLNGAAKNLEDHIEYDESLYD